MQDLNLRCVTQSELETDSLTARTTTHFLTKGISSNDIFCYLHGGQGVITIPERRRRGKRPRTFAHLRDQRSRGEHGGCLLEVHVKKFEIIYCFDIKCLLTGDRVAQVFMGEGHPPSPVNSHW